MTIETDRTVLCAEHGAECKATLHQHTEMDGSITPYMCREGCKHGPCGLEPNVRLTHRADGEDELILGIFSTTEHAWEWVEENGWQTQMDEHQLFVGVHQVKGLRKPLVDLEWGLTGVPDIPAGRAFRQQVEGSKLKYGLFDKVWEWFQKGYDAKAWLECTCPYPDPKPEDVEPSCVVHSPYAVATDSRNGSPESSKALQAYLKLEQAVAALVELWGAEDRMVEDQRLIMDLVHRQLTDDERKQLNERTG